MRTTSHRAAIMSIALAALLFPMLLAAGPAHADKRSFTDERQPPGHNYGDITRVTYNAGWAFQKFRIHYSDRFAHAPEWEQVEHYSRMYVDTRAFHPGPEFAVEIAPPSGLTVYRTKWTKPWKLRWEDGQRCSNNTLRAHDHHHEITGHFGLACLKGPAGEKPWRARVSVRTYDMDYLLDSAPARFRFGPWTRVDKDPR